MVVCVVAVVGALVDPVWGYDADLAWAPVAGAAGYRVYVRAGTQPYGGGNDVGAPPAQSDGALHYTVRGLASDVAYTFGVAAYNTAGESPLSNELALALPATSSPSPTATATRPPTATATWTRPPASTATPVGSATRTATAPPTATFTPTATPTAGCDVQNGQLPAHCGLGGQIETGGSAQPVAGALVTVRNGDVPALTVGSDTTGSYAFPAPAAGVYSVEPSKLGDAGNAVSALDAALVLRASAGIAPLDPLQTLACDVTGNGTVTTLDASRILQAVVGLMPKLPVAEGCGSDWAFVPQMTDSPTCTVTLPVPATTGCQPGRIAFDATAPDLPLLSFTAVLFGDCSRNWHPATGAGLQRRRVAVAAGAPRRRAGGRWVVPLTVAGVGEFRALQMRLRYDQQRLVPSDARGVGGETLAYQHVSAPGELSVALASGVPIAIGRNPAAVIVFDGLEPGAGSPSIRLLAASVDDAPAAVTSPP